jgi:hypothetical protein
MKEMGILDLQHTVRVVGYGDNASKILRCVNGEGIDRVVFFPYCAGWNDTYGPKVYEEKGIVYVRIDFEPGSPLPDSVFAEERVRDFFAYGLHDAIVEDAGRVLFLATLPSLGGAIILKMLKKMSENLSTHHISFSVLLQTPFLFEGKCRVETAKAMVEEIAKYVPDVTVVNADHDIRENGAYRSMRISEAFKICDELMASKVNEYLKNSGSD